MNETTNWLFGMHVIDEVVRKQGISAEDILYIARNSDTPQMQNLLRKCGNANAQIRKISYKALSQLTHTENHQGIALQKNEQIMPLELKYEQIIENIPGVFVALDRVTDVQNIGAIARSALALGAKGLILPERRSAPLNAVAFKASAGALSHIPVMHTSGVSSFLERVIKDNTYIQRIGLSMNGTEMTHEVLRKVHADYPVILVAGSEEGLSPLAEKRCDFLWRLPVKPPAESFNVSVAVALALYTLR